jgi:hypothetical protein
LERILKPRLPATIIFHRFFQNEAPGRVS